jgi:hypothetical protein
MSPSAHSACFNRFVGPAVLVGLLAGPLYAASPPREELLRFVPDDVGFCVVLQDLRGHTADVVQSPFAELVRRSPLGAMLNASVELKQLDKVDKDLKALLGVGWAELRDDVLGDAVVFAYRPGPPGKPEQEVGLVLVRARTAEALAGLVDNLNKAQRKDGTVKELTDVEYQGVTYRRRVEAKQTTFYYLNGPVLLFTGQEDMLRQALDRNRKAAAGEESPLARRLRAVGADKAALALWLNPRAFDAALEEKASHAADPEAALLKHFREYWKAVDGVGMYADLDKDLRLSWVEQFRPDDLPAPARRVLAAASRPSDLWRAFPDDALIAWAGRSDWAAMFEMVNGFQPKDKDAAGKSSPGDALGKEFFTEALLPKIGPDWGFCVTAPEPGTKDPLPRGFFALRVAGGDDAPVDKAILSAAHTAVLFAVVAYNHQHPDAVLRLMTLTKNKAEIYYLVGERVFPPGVQPAYGLRDGWLLVASSPDLVGRFALGPSPKTPPEDGAPFPVLRVSFKACRAFLQDRRDPLASLLAEKNQIGKEEAGKTIDDLVGVLQLVDRLEVTQSYKPGQVVVTLTVQPSQPLKK